MGRRAQMHCPGGDVLSSPEMELAKIPDVLGAHKLCEAARRLFGNVVLIPEELGGERFSRRNFCRIPLLVQSSWHQMHRRL
jgi:hypothetical protein